MRDSEVDIQLVGNECLSLGKELQVKMLKKINNYEFSCIRQLHCQPSILFDLLK